MLALNPAAMLHLLNGCDEHLPPARLLAGLSGDEACATVPGLPNSIATLVGHMTYWQDHTIGWLSGELPPAAPVDDSVNLPQIAPAEWDALLARFLGGFERLSALAAGETGTEFYKGRSLGFMMAMSAFHNTYHLAQIVCLRRLLGCWPPPEV